MFGQNPLGGMFGDTLYYGNTLEQYIVFFLIALASFLVGKVLYYLFKYEVRKITAKTKTRFDDMFIDIVEEPLVLMFVIIGLSFAFQTLSLDAGMMGMVNAGLGILASINVIWFAVRFFDVLLGEYLQPFVGKSETKLDDEMMPILRKGVKAIIIIIGVIAITSNLGYDLTAVIAGLGIGGIAIAFAAQDTISNMFGGLSIFMDRPFAIGDRVKVNDIYGDVLDVGLRSSKIKTLDNTIVSVPNSIVSKNAVENFVRPDTTLKKTFKLGLVYNTPTAKVEKAVEIIKDVLGSTEGVAQKEPLVWFTEFADSALEITAIYWIKAFKYGGTAKHTINLEIKKRFEKEGIEMAYPTQTIHLER